MRRRAVRLVSALGVSCAAVGCAMIGGLGDFTEVSCVDAVCSGGGTDAARGPDGELLEGGSVGVDGGGRDASGGPDAPTESGGPGGVVVISEIYASGSKSGASYQRDYVVLKNTGSAAVNVGGWSFQHYKTGAGWQVLALTATSIPAGGAYLIQLYYDGGSLIGASLPPPALAAPDTNAWNLSTTNGEAVAIVTNTSALTSCTSAAIVDLVGYVTGAPCSEGGTIAPTTTATQSARRKASGTQDTNDNAADFVLGPPSP